MKKILAAFIIWTAMLWIVNGCSSPELLPPEDMVASEPLATQEQEVSEVPEEPMFNIPQVEAEVVDSNEPMAVAMEEPMETADTTEVFVDENITAEVKEPVEDPVVPVVTPDVNVSEDLTDEDNVSETLQADSAEDDEPLEKVFEPYTEELGVLKVEIGEATLRFIIRDPIAKFFALENPDRIVLEFKPLSYFEPMKKSIESPAFASISTASHEQYNRVVIQLNEKRQFTITKNPSGDWVLTLK